MTWLRRHPAAQFLGALLLALVTSPFTESLPDGDLIEALRLTVVLVSGVVAVGGRRRMLVAGILLAAPALVGKWVNHWLPALVPDWMFLVPAVLFVLLLLTQTLRFILLSPRVNSEVLCAGVAGYLLLGLLWSFAYILAARLNPGAFTFTAGPASDHLMKGFTAIYYSFITLCTVGYGDIVPASGAARMLAMMEGIVGTFYMAILVARLVSLHTAIMPDSKPGNSPEK
ncbi:MAG: potassium channel family protein [Methylococcaceae bacterium]|nr:potassium channel family protein [Methylococcaceae bacterium]